MKKRVPDFQSEDEERAFWAEHDSTDYLDWYRARTVTFPQLTPSLPAFVLLETPGKGRGVFAARPIKRGELIFHVDLRPLAKMTPAEIDAHPELDGDHSDYVGHGKYVVDDSPASYMNHSCDPNCYYTMRSIAVKDVYALRDIEEGEELTHDYAATSVDQFAGAGFWVLECRCGSENCRGRVTGDFFELPAELQRRYYPNLPPSIKRRYRANLAGVARSSV